MVTLKQFVGFRLTLNKILIFIDRYISSYNGLVIIYTAIFVSERKVVRRMKGGHFPSPSVLWIDSALEENPDTYFFSEKFSFSIY